MSNARLAGRYAKSLLDLALEQGQLETVYADMKYVQAVCKASAELVNLLRSPIIKADQKEMYNVGFLVGGEDTQFEKTNLSILMRILKTVMDISLDLIKKYPNVAIYGVEWMLNTLNCTLFTADEFFKFFEEVIGPILEEKIYG